MKKRFTKRLFAGVMAALMITSTSLLSVNAVGQAAEKDSDINITVPFNGSGATLQSDKTYKLPSIISGLTGTKYDVTISNNKVANYKNGQLVTVGTGDVTVTVTLANGLKLSKTFHVQKPEVAVSFESDFIKLSQGQKQKLKAIVSQSKGKLTWSSSNAKIVSVDQNGNITAKKAGTATITVKTTTGKTASCKIRVGDPVAVEAVRLNKTEVTLAKGQTFQIHGTVTPSYATDKSLKCTSSNANIAAVSYGKVTAKSSGTAYITVKSNNGKSAVCKVTVVNPVAVQKVNLNKTSVTLKPGQSFQLCGSVAPANATDKALKCTSSNASVASVSYGKITAKSVGTANITVKSANGQYAVCKVTVTK